MKVWPRYTGGPLASPENKTDVGCGMILALNATTYIYTYTFIFSGGDFPKKKEVMNGILVW